MPGLHVAPLSLAVNDVDWAARATSLNCAVMVLPATMALEPHEALLAALSGTKLTVQSAAMYSQATANTACCMRQLCCVGRQACTMSACMQLMLLTFHGPGRLLNDTGLITAADVDDRP